MKFVKMHGCGNDYVYLDGVTDPSIAARIGRDGWTNLVKRMSDRHKGIGSDGVIVLCPPSPRGGTGRSAALGGETSGEAHVRMRMFNADGSESEMCGNGIRCVAKFAHDRLGMTAKPLKVETGRGILSIDYTTGDGKVVEATVDMGEPILAVERVPVDIQHLYKQIGPHEFLLGTRKLEQPAVFVSMGNPHAVLFDSPLASASTILEDLRLFNQHEDRFVFQALGSEIEHHSAFPRRTNAHWVKRVSNSEGNVLTWERGSGITQACGTGACAVLVAGVLTNRFARDTRINLLGGSLRIRWDQSSNHVFMTGEAIDICEGVWFG